MPLLLFRRLTGETKRGAALFEVVAREARQPHWFVQGEVPDTLDGRFRMLATVAALAIVRLEQSGPDGDLASAALTERFIEAMDADHREIGIGDPALGRTVRKLVAALERRVDWWRSATASEIPWSDAARQSVYSQTADEHAVAHTAVELERWWARLGQIAPDALAQGRLSN